MSFTLNEMDMFIDSFFPPPVPSRMDRFINEILNSMEASKSFPVHERNPVNPKKLYSLEININFTNLDSKGRKHIIPKKLHGMLDDLTYRLIKSKKSFNRDRDRDIIKKIVESFDDDEQHGDTINQYDSQDYEVEVKSVTPQVGNTPRDMSTIPLKKQTKGNIQDTVNTKIVKYLKFGKISDDSHYIENGCMVSCFLDTFDSRLITYRNLLNPKSLYEMATGQEYKSMSDIKDWGLSLEQITKWMEKWKLDLLAINIHGKIIFEYKSKSHSKKIKGGHVYRIMIHNEHVWTITDNLKEFDQKFTEKRETNTKRRTEKFNIKIDSLKTEFGNMNKLKPYEEKTYGYIQSFDEFEHVVEPTGTATIRHYITKDVENLFKEFWYNGYEPSNIKMSSGIVNSFDVCYFKDNKKIQISIRSPLSVDIAMLECQPIISMVQDISMELCKTMKFDKYLYDLRSLLMPNKGMSTYSESLYKNLKRFTRGGIVSFVDSKSSGSPFTNEDYDRFKNDFTTGKNQTYEIDINRAYSHAMINIDKIPIFNSFDEFHELPDCWNSGLVELEAHINDESFYICEVLQTDCILLTMKYEMVTGFTLSYLKTINQLNRVKILQQCKPYSFIKIEGFKDKVKEIYEDSELTSNNKKDLLNIVYGLSTKSKNKIQSGQCYTSKKEFRGSYVEHEYKNSSLGYVVVKTKSIELKDGYLPISRIILDKHRINLHKLYMTLSPIPIYGVRVDAIYISGNSSGFVNNPSFKNGDFKISSSKNFEDIGSIRITKKEFQHLPITFNGSIGKVIEPYFVKNGVEQQENTASFANGKSYKKLDDEYKTMNNDWEEFDSKMTNKTILRGLVGGVGKTYALTKYFERHEMKCLMITPWNMLAEDVGGITLYKLLGKIPEEFQTENKTNKKEYSLDGITNINFEEIFLYNINELMMIKNFMESHRDIFYTATGDSSQLQPIGTENQFMNGYSDSYMNMVIDSLFPNCIMLEISKRVRNRDEANIMIKIANRLRTDLDGKISLDELIELSNGKIKTGCLDEILKSESDDVPNICYLKKSLERINKLCHKHTMLYYEGLELLGTGYLTGSNVLYKVRDVNDEFITIYSIHTNVEKTYSYEQASKSFKYKYCRTVHSSQGLSLGNKIHIHDYNFYRVNNRFLYTAITRCSTLDILFLI